MPVTSASPLRAEPICPTRVQPGAIGRGFISNGGLLGQGRCFMKELEQNILGKPQAKCLLPRTSEMARPRPSPACPPRGTSTGERLTDQEALGMREPVAVGPTPEKATAPCRSTLALVDPDAGTKGGSVDFLALGYLVEFHELVGPRQRIRTRAMILPGASARLLRPAVEPVDCHPPQPPGPATSSSAPRSAESTANRRPESQRQFAHQRAGVPDLGRAKSPCQA